MSDRRAVSLLDCGALQLRAGERSALEWFDPRAAVGNTAAALRCLGLATRDPLSGPGGACMLFSSLGAMEASPPSSPAFLPVLFVRLFSL